MSSKALIIGGTGQAGRAAVAALLAQGWDVDVMHRSGASLPDVRRIEADRNDSDALEAVLRTGYDAVVDLVAFTAGQVAPLLRSAQGIGSLVVLSSAAVYQDGAGRTLQTVTGPDSAPVFDLPITEDAPVVSEAEDSYAGRKRAMEIALLDAADNATIIRPGGIHGPHSSQPREWFYAKRILDGRKVFVHGFGGRGSLHPTSVDNLAEMIRLAALKPGSRILNSGDPNRPDERSMAQAIAAAMNQEVTQVLLPGVPEIASPWSLPSPFFLSTAAAEQELGYRAVTTYERTAHSIAEWIRAEIEAGVFQSRLDRAFGVPGLGSQVFVGNGGQPFDYALEDRAIARLEEATRASANA